MKVAELTTLATIAGLLTEDPHKREVLLTLARSLSELMSVEEDLAAVEGDIKEKEAKVNEMLSKAYEAKARIDRDKKYLVENRLAAEKRIIDIVRKFL